MLLNDHMRRSGEALFRNRSFIPLVLLPFVGLAVAQGERFEQALGERPGDAIEMLAILLVMAGQAIRILTVGFVPAATSGRNTKGQLAESLNVTGAYSLCRNPLYLGNVMMYLGAVLYCQDLTLLLVMVPALALYYERIISAEESFLAHRFGAAYAGWAAKVPAFWPRLRGWTPPALSFSLKTVIRREQASILGAVVVLYAITLAQGLHEPGDAMDAGWNVALAATLILYVAARTAKKSGWLRVTGR